jgi:hypothetical protein
MNNQFAEGTWFGVPLKQGGFALGRVARHSPSKEIVLAYFFGPKRDVLPKIEELQSLTAEDAIKVMMVGYLGLDSGSWPIIGSSEPWDRADWPIPWFIRRDELSGTAWAVSYADDNPNQVVSEERIPYDTPGLERDALYGDKAAEHVLSSVLA